MSERKLSISSRLRALARQMETQRWKIIGAESAGELRQPLKRLATIEDGLLALAREIESAARPRR